MKLFSLLLLVGKLFYLPWTLAVSSLQPCFSLQTSQIIERHLSTINQIIISNYSIWRKKEDRTERAFLCKRLFRSVESKELVKMTRRIILFGNISWFTKSLSVKIATLYKSHTSCWGLFLESPENYSGRKFSCQTEIYLFWKADLLTSFESKKNQHDYEV